MNVCLIGDGLISLTLAKTLINKKIKVFMYYENNRKIPNDNRTIGISSDNLDFIQKKIVKINKNLIWEINKIEIYNDQNTKEKILNFQQSNKRLFSIIKNNNLYKLLINSLKKNNKFKKIKIKNKSFYSKILNNQKFDLVINCDGNNEISTRYFYQKIIKDYVSTAYATIINHNKINNQEAIQIFTKHGPLAFLPISMTQTSVVYSIKNKSINNYLRFSQVEFEKLILENKNIITIGSNIAKPDIPGLVKADIDGPGHSPTRPQPTPNKAEPITNFLSISCFEGNSISIPSTDTSLFFKK